MSERATLRHPYVRAQLRTRDVFSHGMIIAKRTPFHRRRFRIILSPGNFVVNERDSAVRLSCLGTIRATREMVKASFTTVSSRILADLPVRSLARSFARSVGRQLAGQLPPVSGVVARRAGSRLNHLLRRTTAPRHHLGPRDVQANRLTRKFRTLLRVFRPTLFSFPFLVTPCRWLLPLSVNQKRCTGAVFLTRNNFRSLFLCVDDPLRATLENPMLLFCNNHKEEKLQKKLIWIQREDIQVYISQVIKIIGIWPIV